MINFLFGKKIKREDIIVTPSNLFSLDDVKSSQSQYRKHFRKGTKTLQQQSITLDENDETENDDPIEIRTCEGENPCQPDSSAECEDNFERIATTSLNFHPTTSEEYNDNLHETYLSVVKRASEKCFHDLSILKRTSHFSDISRPIDTPQHIDATLKYQYRVSGLKFEK